MVPATRALVAALCVVLCVPAVAGIVTGTVRAADTHQPLGSKVVAAYDTAGTLAGSATTDATGLYSLTLPGGSYRVLAYDPGGAYATAFDANAESFETSPLTAVSVNGTVFRDFSLVPGGIVSGTVTGPSGAPRSTAVVEAYNLSGTRRAFTNTDANGAYSLVLPPGEYKLVAYDSNPAFAFSFYPGVRTFAEAGRVTATASRPLTNVDLRIDLAARVSGMVTDAATGVSLPNVTVYAYTADGNFVDDTGTDANGVFRFSLPPGDYRFVAADPSRVYAPGFFGSTTSFETATTLNVHAGEQASNIDVALARGATVAGVVRDASGAAVANVTIAAYNLDGTLYTTANTNGSGAYQLALAAGAYKLAAFDPQGTFATQFFGNARDFDTTGAAAVVAGQQIGGANFTVVRGGRISGTVRDGAAPRGGITVAAYDAAGLLTASTTTAADGTYALVVRPGDYRIVAFDAGFGYAPAYDGGAKSFDETVPRSVAANAAVTVDLSLRHGVLLRGDVVDSDGQAVNGINVYALDGAGNRVAGATTADGAFSLVVPADAYKFVAIDPAGRHAVTYFEHAETLAAATWVTVNQGTTLRIVLEQARLRRRTARH